MKQTSPKVIRQEEREWVEFQIPESSPPVELSRLSQDPASRAQTLLVRFAPGWSRPSTGYYEASEEFFVLEGDLTIGESTFGPGDYALIPAGALRGPSSSKQGALTLAHFDGPARWQRPAGTAND
jgi:hypothetical protein